VRASIDWSASSPEVAATERVLIFSTPVSRSGGYRVQETATGASCGRSTA
jgi:hypothetical protein